MIHEMTIRVYYEDTDMAGIVYYANYLRFMERGRSEAVRDAGIDQTAMRDDQGVVFAVRRAAIDYHAPARFDDLLSVRTWTDKVGAATLAMGQEVRRDGTLLTSASFRIACMTLDGRPSRFPPGIRLALAGLLPQNV